MSTPDPEEKKVQKKELTILGIDPGSRKMGYAIIKIQKGGKIKYEECGMITANVKAPLTERLTELGDGLSQLFEEYHFDEAAVEDVFMSINVKSAFILGQARGMVLYLIGSKKINMSSYAPTKVKKFITGSGRAPKSQVRKMVTMLAGLSKEPPEDAGDALSVAYCHAMHLSSSFI